MRRSLLYVVCCVFVFSACNDSEGWTDLGEGVSMKLLAFDEGTKTIQHSTYSEVAFYLSPVDDQELVCFSNSEIEGEVGFGETCDFLSQHVFGLSAGDSVAFNVQLSKVKCGLMNDLFDRCPLESDSQLVQFTVAVRAVYDSSNFARSPRALRAMRLLEERDEIERWLSSSEYAQTVRHDYGGWYVVLQEGVGPSARQGDEVILAYKGRTLDGKVFDLAQDSTDWLYYPYGKPDQVIRGIEIAVSQMKPGEHRLIWLTSDLAFGDRGSGGIVSPGTPVQFDLQVVNILRFDSLEADTLKVVGGLSF